jgi:hypothetical protein
MSERANHKIMQDGASYLKHVIMAVSQLSVCMCFI